MPDVSCYSLPEEKRVFSRLILFPSSESNLLQNQITVVRCTGREIYYVIFLDMAQTLLQQNETYVNCFSVVLRL